MSDRWTGERERELCTARNIKGNQFFKVMERSEREVVETGSQTSNHSYKNYSLYTIDGIMYGFGLHDVYVFDEPFGSKLSAGTIFTLLTNSQVSCASD